MKQIKHIAIIYIINDLKNEIKNNIAITHINDDSMGAEYYDIVKLKNDELSNIALLALEKLNYIKVK